MSPLAALLLLSAAAAAPASIDQVKWLAPKGGTMIGVGRTVRGGKLVEYEFVLLRERDGKLAYQAHPSGQPSAVFLSKEVGPTAVVFENLEHDFPQRVGYGLDASGNLIGWIEGTRDGTSKRIEFPYRKAACGGER